MCIILLVVNVETLSMELHVPHYRAKEISTNYKYDSMTSIRILS